MDTAAHVFTDSKSPQLGRWAAPPSPVRLPGTVTLEHANKYFGGLESVTQYGGGLVGLMEQTTGLQRGRDTTVRRSLRLLDAYSLHGLTSSDSLRWTPTRPTQLMWVTDPQHGFGEQSEESFILQVLISGKHTVSTVAVESSAPDLEVPPFVLLDQARTLLSHQRIAEARLVLQAGVASYPNDREMVNLLRAVSPGRAQRKPGTSTDWEQEKSWIRKHGRDHRGQWVAVSGDRLVAVANTLKALLADTEATDSSEEPPLVQYIVED